MCNDCVRKISGGSDPFIKDNSHNCVNQIIIRGIEKNMQAGGV